MGLLSVVVPVKDEGSNVGPLYDQIRAALVDAGPWEAVFVDDGSRDATAAELGRTGGGPMPGSR